MRYVSVCSGIEAATVAWHPLGWTPLSFAEIERFPSQILKYHYPEVKNVGDFTTIRGDEFGPVDVLVGGTPCQDFSVAGLRAGMDGKRGQLTVEFARLAGRMRPRWLVWENVPGVLSIDRGRAFGAFLGILGELGYGLAYRVLDAQHFGVPQRRRRVFVVGYLGDWRRAAAVLFERHCLQGNPAPSREARKDAPDFTARSVAIRGRDGIPSAELGDDKANAVLTPNGGRGGIGVGAVLAGSAGRWPAEVAPTLDSHYGDKQGLEDKLAPTLRAGGHSRSHANAGVMPAIAIQERAICENPDAGPDGVGVRYDGTAYKVEARQVPQAVAFAQNQRNEIRELSVAIAQSSIRRGDANNETLIASPITASYYKQIDSSDTSKGPPNLVQVYGLDSELNPVRDGSGPLKSISPSGGGVPAMVSNQMQVRRLTPVECERLQGFPDNYTKIGDKTADGPRYKSLGNSMAVPCMRWIGERIKMVDAL